MSLSLSHHLLTLSFPDNMANKFVITIVMLEEKRSKLKMRLLNDVVAGFSKNCRSRKGPSSDCGVPPGLVSYITGGVSLSEALNRVAASGLGTGESSETREVQFRKLSEMEGLCIWCVRTGQAHKDHDDDGNRAGERPMKRRRS